MSPDRACVKGAGPRSTQWESFIIPLATNLALFRMRWKEQGGRASPARGPSPSRGALGRREPPESPQVLVFLTQEATWAQATKAPKGHPPKSLQDPRPCGPPSGDLHFDEEPLFRSKSPQETRGVLALAARLPGKPYCPLCPQRPSGWEDPLSSCHAPPPSLRASECCPPGADTEKAGSPLSPETVFGNKVPT